MLLAALVLLSPSVQPREAQAADRRRYLLEIPLAEERVPAAILAGRFDVAGINRREKTAQIVAGDEDAARLRSLGFIPRAVRERDALARVPVELELYTDPLELELFLDRVAADHPGIARKVPLNPGPLAEGRTVWAMQITADPDADHDRPAFILDAQHHAREVMTVEIALDMIDYLTSNYDTDPRVKWWVDNIVIWVVPSVNPDGAAYMFKQDEWWRKNRNPNPQCADLPGTGVDLNRNYPWGWGSCPGGSGGECAAEDYRGPFPASEPETQGMEALMAQARAIFALTYHSFGEYLLYPYGCGNSSEGVALAELAFGLNALLENDAGMTGGWKVGPGWSLYPTDGTSDDTAYARYGTFTYAIEVNGDSFQPDYRTWRDVTVQRQRTAWQYFLNRTLDTPSIQGYVTDSATGAPLQATVTLAEAPLANGESPRKADARGRYFRVTRAGRTYHATFSLNGYMTRTCEVAVGEGTARLDVALDPRPYRITVVSVLLHPFRLLVQGEGFKPGCRIRIDGVRVPLTVFRSSSRLVAREGAALRAIVPRGREVRIRVTDGAGGSSNTFLFAR